MVAVTPQKGAGIDSAAVPHVVIVGDDDQPVIEMNQATYELLTCEKKLVIIPDATHLFEEPATLEQVADRACSWFQLYVQQDGETAAR